MLCPATPPQHSLTRCLTFTQLVKKLFLCFGTFLLILSSFELGRTCQKLSCFCLCPLFPSICHHHPGGFAFAPRPGCCLPSFPVPPCVYAQMQQCHHFPLSTSFLRILDKVTSRVDIVCFYTTHRNLIPVPTEAFIHIPFIFPNLTLCVFSVARLVRHLLLPFQVSHQPKDFCGLKIEG